MFSESVISFFKMDIFPQSHVFTPRVTAPFQLYSLCAQQSCLHRCRLLPFYALFLSRITNDCEKPYLSLLNYTYAVIVERPISARLQYIKGILQIRSLRLKWSLWLTPRVFVWLLPGSRKPSALCLCSTWSTHTVSRHRRLSVSGPLARTCWRWGHQP